MRFDFIHTHTQSPLSLSTVAHTQSRDDDTNNNGKNDLERPPKALDFGAARFNVAQKARDDMCVREFLSLYKESD